jgi:hypothetical protein
MSYGQISTNLGLSYSCYYAEVGTHWDGGSAFRFWKKAGVFRGTVEGVEQNEAPPNYHRNLCLSMRNRLLLNLFLTRE